MRHSWSTKKIGEVVCVVMGQSPPSSTYNENGKGLPFFQGKAEFCETYPVAVKYCSAPIRIAEAGDVLVCVRAPVGIVNIAKEKSCIGRGLAAVRADNKILNQRFLYYFLKLNENNWSKLSTGSTFVAIRRDNLENLKIPLPTLNIQHQIVERLDAIKKAQELNAKQIALAEELFRSLLHKELDSKGKNWEVKKIGDIAEVTSSKRIFQSEYIADGIPFYRTKEIVELSQNKPISLELFISEKRFDEINKKFGVPQKGDILISAVGTIGISWIVPNHRKFYFKDGNLLWIKNFNGIDSHYLKLVLDNIFKSIFQLAAGAAYNALTIIKLKKIKISVPPLKTQRQIVEKLQATLDYKKKLLEQKQKLQELFNSCLDRAMKGKLVR